MDTYSASTARADVGQLGGRLMQSTTTVAPSAPALDALGKRIADLSDRARALNETLSHTTDRLFGPVPVGGQTGSNVGEGGVLGALNAELTGLEVALDAASDTARRLSRL